MTNMLQGDNKKVPLSALKRGLYIHIPFCVQKCRYCDFISYCGREELYDNYIEALAADIKAVWLILYLWAEGHRLL